MLDPVFEGHTKTPNPIYAPGLVLELLTPLVSIVGTEHNVHSLLFAPSQSLLAARHASLREPNIIRSARLWSLAIRGSRTETYLLDLL